MNIKYLTYQNIDKEKWDECVSSSKNHLVYAESWYLDIVCSKNWDALILNDYETVVPLPLKSKMGLTYVQQPIWTQQLGIFSKYEITANTTHLFLKEIPTKLAIISLNLNETNFSNQTKLTTKTNLVLKLNKPFEDLQTSFSSNTKRNCKKSRAEKLEIDFENNNINLFIDFFKENISKPISEFHHNSLKELVTKSIQSKKGCIMLVKHQNEIVAASFILKSKNRLIYRTGTSNEKGKKLKAMFFLIESLIKKHEDSNYLLDFEGSEIDGVARFYKGFGAKDQPYYYYKKTNNKLLKLVGK